MIPTNHNAQPKYSRDALRVDQPRDADELPERIAAIDPTEELTDDRTWELPHPSIGTSVAPPRLIDADVDGAKCEPAGKSAFMNNGTVLRDRYLLEQQLGNGGTALISRARDLRHDGATNDGPNVAIKQLRPEFRDRPQHIARLMREFRQTRSLAHPNIVQFYDLDCDRGTWFIAMELLTGEALGQRLRRASPQGLPAREAFRIAAACGDALAFAHDRGVTHGDVKPDNVFVTATDEVRVLDFGVAPESVLPAPAQASTTDLVVPAATRAYASPEVLEGQVPEPRDDVFSLACVIYEMLAGRHPYRRRGANEARDAGLTIQPVPGMPTSQWRALAAGLAWRRERRPADVRELLGAFGAEAPARAIQRALPAPVLANSGGPWWMSRGAWGGSIAVAAIVGLLIGSVRFGSQVDPPTVSRATPVATGVTTGEAPAGGTAAVVATPAAVRPATAGPSGATPIVVVPPARSPTPPAHISFDAAAMVVSRRAVAAAIPVRRLDQPDRRVSVTWRTMDGTALAGRDYGGPQTGLASFAEGQKVHVIYVPIVNEAEATGDRTFTVELTAASPRASLGSIRRLIVTIENDR